MRFSVFLSEYAPVKWKEVMDDFQTELISLALWKTGGNKARASRMLGMNRTTLVERMKKLGIAWDDDTGDIQVAESKAANREGT